MKTKKIKKILSLMLTLVLFFSCVSVKVFAGSAYEQLTVNISGSTGNKTGTYFVCDVTYASVLSAGQVLINFDVSKNDLYTNHPTITTIEVYDGSTNLQTYNNINSVDAKGKNFYYTANSVPSSLIFKIYYEVPSYTLTGASSLTSGGGVTFKVNGNTVTEASSGDYVTATAIAVEGYEAKLSAKGANDNLPVSINNGTFKMPAKAVTVTATYTPYDYLDLESSTSYLASKDLVQNYTFTQSGDVTYNDVTKVKLEWTLPDIQATYTSNKTWNPDTLTWDESKTTETIGQKIASFTFTNNSSVAVGAKLSFKKNIGTDEKTYSSDVLTLDTFVNEDHSIKSQAANIGTLTHTYTPNTSDFDSLNAGSGKYGSYTISIVSAVKVIFDLQGYGSAISAQYVGIGGKIVAPTAPIAVGYQFDGWYTDADCSEGNEWDFATGTVTEAKTLYAKWSAL